jgi:hypothetical protein
MSDIYSSSVLPGYTGNPHSSGPQSPYGTQGAAALVGDVTAADALHHAATVPSEEAKREPGPREEHK